MISYQFVATERTRAGFAPNHPTFRIEGPPGGLIEPELRDAGATTVLETAGPTGTVCLVSLPPEALAGFRAGVLDLVARGEVTRVEAAPSV